ncbi:spore coat U domain-containing protein [Rosenbergiella australiborealis]|uniref:Csu type fimbrial protein n=1 Tax=Rosenbergiella australiborealis TaxID=1544696 RepID=UPI001F4DC33A|nr:spore coat U domain-containing protein [Rosenbergiella australiborealis]
MVRSRWYWVPLFFSGACCSSSAVAGTTTATFQVSAIIKNGCALGTSSASSTSNFGTINFGTMTAITANVDTASTTGAGSIIVTCTPGMAITIALDYGVNGGSATKRYLALGQHLLGYQLYQDASHSVVWGLGSLAYSVSAFPQTTQTYTVYGRLFSSSTLPTTGTYTDTVTVTLAY